MKKIFIFSFLFLPTLCLANPRYPVPDSPSQVWQNDLDLWDEINRRVSNSSTGTGYCIDDPTLCVDTVNNIVKTNGGIIRNTERITGALTLGTTHHIVFADTDGAAFTVSLPAGVEGTNYKIINVGSSANDLSVDPNGTEQLYGSGAGVASAVSDGEVINIHYNATEGWW